MAALYKIVTLPAQERVSFVGVEPALWPGSQHPEIGFVALESGAIQTLVEAAQNVVNEMPTRIRQENEGIIDLANALAPFEIDTVRKEG